MNILRLQTYITDKLNADEKLRAGGCLAIAEDRLDFVQQVERQLATVQGVAMVVLTPSLTRSGDGEEPGTLSVACDALTVACVELVAVNRLRPGAMTALQAATRAALILDGQDISFSSIDQELNTAEGSIKASAVFSVNFTLSD